MAGLTPPVSALELSSDPADFVWSADGKLIAAAVRDSIAIFKTGDGTCRNLLLSPKAEVGDLAWSPDGSSILASIRTAHSEFDELQEIELASGSCRLRRALQGDIRTPLWLPDGRSFLYHVNRQGNMPVVAADSDEPRLLLPGVPLLGRQVQGFDPIRHKAFVLSKSSSGPPMLIEAPIDGCQPVILHRGGPGALSSWPSVSPQLVEFPSFDRTLIHGWVWRTPQVSSGRRSVLIEVHGGPHLPAAAEWDAGKQFLLRKGVSLLSVDYRGSTGYGATFERMGSIVDQAKDVLAARDYAARTFEVPHSRMFLLGSSYGASAAALACACDPGEIGGAVFLSFPGRDLPFEAPAHAPPWLLGFHGQNDDICSPKKARAAIERHFGSNVFRHPCGRWEVLPAEGHQFHRTRSWALIYSRLLPLLSDEVTSGVMAGEPSERGPVTRPASTSVRPGAQRLRFTGSRSEGIPIVKEGKSTDPRARPFERTND